MIDSFELKNFGPIHQLECKNVGHINLIIGGNSSGKTFLLKALYSALRTLEEYRRGNEPRSDAEILASKLYWTFEIERLGSLVSKGKNAPLNFRLTLDGQEFSYELGREATRSIENLTNNVFPRSSNSIFLPTKEVVSIHRIILESREQSRTFGFDDTYLDLARALRQLPKVVRKQQEFTTSCDNLNKMLGGKVEYDEQSQDWQFKQGDQKFSIGTTAEGFKKISILDTLLRNGYLDSGSIMFIDEPESALHPKAISDFLDIIALLSEAGIQFFMASHSYFVIKKLLLIAQENPNLSVSIISAKESGWDIGSLSMGLPDNPIIDESIRLYKEEVDLALR